MKKNRLLFLLLFITNSVLQAEDGYRLWLRYNLISDSEILRDYEKQITGFNISGSSTILKAAEEELINGLTGLMGKVPANVNLISKDGILIAGTPLNSSSIKSLNILDKLQSLGEEGYLIKTLSINNNRATIIAANNDIGVLYGVFHFLRLLQTHQDIKNLSIESSPKIKVRILNHWDNLDRTVERGYAGFSIWDWHRLPDYIDARYKDYARANASIGINGTVLTNVNANALVLTSEYLLKIKALADIFRHYGIKVYLTARFSAPIETGGLETADPLNENVRRWWKLKVKEIYSYIPDFGGFLVKANSEGQPGPQNYNRTHADGANMLADALLPYDGIVMWRAFVYSDNNPEDRAKQAFNEFKPLDGNFSQNVLIQVKNGPIDFQPREPFHPLFGAMPATPMMMEFQITQEYLGQGTHLVFLSPLFKECLNSDTYAKGKESTVARVVDGSLFDHPLSGIAGVANVGTDRNWTGHIFGQANWYAFGRLAWNYKLSSDEIAEEWIRMTFSNNSSFIDKVSSLMLFSRENTVNYMTPLGLHHMMGWDHHYGPAPWIKDKPRADWTSVYYHKADSSGIGFDRTTTGSNAVSQYFPEVSIQFASIEKCPEEYLLWFHHLNWDYKLESGNSLWEELCYRYYLGVDSAESMINTWESLKGRIDDERFEHVRMLLTIQKKEAIWWRNACILYFQTFSRKAIPEDLEQPEESLDYYKSLKFPYAPGIKPKW